MNLQILKPYESTAIQRLRSPAVLTLKEIPKPEPRKGEVLIQIKATAINPSDVKNVAGHFKASLPRVPGRDYAGVVVGGDAEKGLEVWGSGAGFGVVRDGAHTEYVVGACRLESRKSRHHSRWSKLRQAEFLFSPRGQRWWWLAMSRQEKRCSLLVFPAP